MKNPRLLGIALLTAGSVLLAALAYEPSNIVAALNLEGVASEGSVALLSLLAIAASGIAGIGLLRSRV